MNLHYPPSCLHRSRFLRYAENAKHGFPGRKKKSASRFLIRTGAMLKMFAVIILTPKNYRNFAGILQE